MNAERLFSELYRAGLISAAEIDAVGYAVHPPPVVYQPEELLEDVAATLEYCDVSQPEIDRVVRHLARLMRVDVNVT